MFTSESYIENNKYSIFQWVSLILSSIALIFVLTFFLGITNNIRILAVFAVLSLSFLSLLNYKLAYSFLLILMFLPYFAIIHQSALFSIILFFSVIITFTKYPKIFDDKVFTSLIFYIMVALISVSMSGKPLFSIRDMINLIAIILVYFSTVVGIRDNKSMIRVYFFFIAAVFFHSIYVIYEGISTGDRVFGLLWVYYIDFAGLGLLLTVILLFVNRGFNKIIYIGLPLVISFGFILTQTRNAWISFLVSFIFLLIVLFFNSKKIGIKKTPILLISGILFGVMTFFVLKSSNVGSQIEDRFDQNKQSFTVSQNHPDDTSSLMTRLFIWHTAYMAFNTNPILGIGVYSFKYTSQKFYKIPKMFYKYYVQNRTTHMTFIQVLTETGIIGFIFFLYFIFRIIQKNFLILKNLSKSSASFLNIAILSSFAYILFSMFMTESWLFGQYAVWFGVQLGFLENLSSQVPNDD